MFSFDIRKRWARLTKPALQGENMACSNRRHAWWSLSLVCIVVAGRGLDLRAAALTLTTAPAAADIAQGPRSDGFVDVAGARLFYRDSGGTGIPVVFLHAATADSRSWENQIPAFTAAGYRFIAFDRRGSGQTVADASAPQPPSADDLMALMDRLTIGRFHLIGSGRGGSVALDAALSFPTRVRSVTMACTAAGPQERAFRDAVARLQPPEFDRLPVDFHELGPSYRAVNPEGTQRWLEFERASRMGGTRSVPPPGRNRITYALLDSMKTPALLIAGGADLYAPPSLVRLVAARIKQSEFVVMPESGHSAYWEQPDLFNDTVLRFIRKH
jgi:pimeloyl-ACP methyl ester carboxylesterase